MNALSYVASDMFVQIAFLALVAFVVGTIFVANGNRRREYLDLRKLEINHQAEMEMKRLDAQIGAVDGKAALPPPKKRPPPGDDD